MNKKKKNKTTLGQYITIFSFLALLIWVITLNIGRTSAQDSEKIIETEFGGEEGEKIKVPELNTDYIESQPREEEFFEGAKCEQANLDCFTKIRQSSEMTGWKAQLVGAPSDEDGDGGEETTSLFNDTAKIFSMLYTPQASANYYVADFLDNMGLISPAYAQGLGYFALSPYLSIWRVFRNFAYACFTGIILVIGIMILFRQNFGGQTAVTAQQALPRVVVALLMVTFSYAIAGFLIDLMYWIMYAFASFTNLNDGSASELISADFGKLGGMIMTGKMGSIFDAVNNIAAGFYSSLLPGANNIFGKSIIWLSGLIGSLIILIAMIFSLFRVLFILLKSYAYVLLNIMFAPFFLMLHALPGVNTFKKWIMSIVANLSPFLMVFFLLVVVGSLNKYFGEESSDKIDGGFVPPYLIGSPEEGYATPKVLGSIVGLAILLAMPEIIDNVKKKLGGDTGFMGEMANAAFNRANNARTSYAGKRVIGGATAIGASIPGAIGAGISNKWRHRKDAGSHKEGFFTGAGRYLGNTGLEMAKTGLIKGGAGEVWNKRKRNASSRQTHRDLVTRAKADKMLSNSKNNPLITARQELAEQWLNKYDNYSEWIKAGGPQL